MKIYHGSLYDIDKTLKIHKPFENLHYSSAVYFTDQKEIALLYALNPIRIYALEKHLNGRANAFSCYFRKSKRVINVYECYKGMFDEIFKYKAYIYSICCDETKDYIFDKNVEFQDKEVVTDARNFLLDARSEYHVQLIGFESIDEKVKVELFDSIASRAGNCESETEISFFREKFAFCEEVQKKLKCAIMKLGQN